MPDPHEEDDRVPNDNDGSNPEGSTAQPTQGQAAEGAQGGQGEGVQQVKHSDFKRIKEEQRARGRREAIEELDAKARAQGFESHDDALKALAALKKTPPATIAAPPKTQPQGAPTMSTKSAHQNTDADRLRAENLRAKEEAAKQRKQWRVENRQRRDLEAQLAAKDAEIALREECYRAGVQDVDYVIRLLTRELQGMSEEEIKAFDRSAFYEQTRKDKPYLFGEKVVPANTGTGGETKKDGAAGSGSETTAAAGQSGGPAPGASATEHAAAKQFNARTAKPEEVANRLRELGLNPHL